jgi:hypothetical protein
VRVLRLNPSCAIVSNTQKILSFAQAAGLRILNDAAFLPLKFMPAANYQSRTMRNRKKRGIL